MMAFQCVQNMDLQAQTIMHLAASRIQLPLDDPTRRPAFSFPCHFQIPSDKHGFIPPNAAVFQSTQTGRNLIWKFFATFPLNLIILGTEIVFPRIICAMCDVARARDVFV